MARLGNTYINGDIRTNIEDSDFSDVLIDLDRFTPDSKIIPTVYNPYTEDFNTPLYTYENSVDNWLKIDISNDYNFEYIDSGELTILAELVINQVVETEMIVTTIEKNKYAYFKPTSISVSDDAHFWIHFRDDGIYIQLGTDIININVSYDLKARKAFFESNGKNVRSQHGITINGLSMAKGSIAIGNNSRSDNGGIAIGSNVEVNLGTHIGCRDLNKQDYICLGVNGTVWDYISEQGGSWNSASDYRDKTDILDIPSDKALEFIQKLKGKTFSFNFRDLYFDEYGYFDQEDYEKATKKNERRQAGFIAQDTYQSMIDIFGDDNYAQIVDYDRYDHPEAKDRYYMSQTSLIPFLVESIKEQQRQIDELKNKLGI